LPDVTATVSSTFVSDVFTKHNRSKKSFGAICSSNFVDVSIFKDMLCYLGEPLEDGACDMNFELD